MNTEKLKNPPLVEAIFEMKWTARTSKPAEPVDVTGQVVPSLSAPDDSYEILLGQLFSRLEKSYPFTERLQTVPLPVPFAPQHRFRKKEGGWPLVQVGPGILTLNDTKNYKWSDFSKRIKQVLDAFYELHPHKSEILVESLVLRYIDAEPFDYEAQNVLPFLQKNLKVRFGLPGNLFDPSEIHNRPEGLSLTVGYRAERPKGVFQLRIATGTVNEKKSVFWETIVVGQGKDAPQLPTGPAEWVADAHALVHGCFFGLISGELQKRYMGNA